MKSLHDGIPYSIPMTSPWYPYGLPSGIPNGMHLRTPLRISEILKAHFEILMKICGIRKGPENAQGIPHGIPYGIQVASLWHPSGIPLRIPLRISLRHPDCIHLRFP